jgi:hypothetical protein
MKINLNPGKFRANYYHLIRWNIIYKIHFMENLKKNVVTCAVLRDEISGDDDRYRESDEDSNYLVTKNATDDKGAVEPARELAVI